MDELAASLSLLAILAFIAFLIWNSSRSQLERRKMRLDAQNQLLDRVGSGQALTDFLQSEEGRNFLDLFKESEKPKRASLNLHASIIGLKTTGVIIIPMGLGFFLAAFVTEWDLMVPAGILMGGGIGCLIAARVQRRLSSQWALLNDDDGDTHEHRTAAAEVL